MTRTTAYVSHSDCPRHDVGWQHPDHQGRLPAITRAVYGDMLALYEPLLQVEATPAAEEDLLLVHTARHLAEVRDTSARAAAEEQTLEVGGVPVSGATWDAVLASVGTALTAVDAVLRGDVRNAFCAARPPGRDATADAPGGCSLVNAVAIAARHLRRRAGAGRVLVVDWGSTRPATAAVLAGDQGVRVLCIHRDPRSFPEGASASESEEGAPSPPDCWTVPPGSGAEAFGEAMRAALSSVEGEVGMVLLSAGFEILAGDPIGGLAVAPDDVHDLTRTLVEWADARAGGRLVSVLEGGYDPVGLARATVQHLRALAGLPPS